MINNSINYIKRNRFPIPANSGFPVVLIPIHPLYPAKQSYLLHTTETPDTTLPFCKVPAGINSDPCVILQGADSI